MNVKTRSSRAVDVALGRDIVFRDNIFIFRPTKLYLLHFTLQQRVQEFNQDNKLPDVIQLMQLI
jgi:hypothetical protein